MTTHTRAAVLTMADLIDGGGLNASERADAAAMLRDLAPQEQPDAVREAERKIIALALQWGCWDRPRWAVERELEDAAEALAAARGAGGGE